MSLLIDPNKFVVPYAVSTDSGEVVVHHIKEGRPNAKHLDCPYCKEPVSFISEGDTRAAHYRHHDRSKCDEKAHLLRRTIHDDVVKATLDLLNGRYVAAKICKGHNGIKMPTGFAEAEKQTTVNGKTYRPDITVKPSEGQIAATLELEVIWSHKPTPERLTAAAKAGRAIGILNAGKIERSYIQKRHLNEAFDIPEAIKEFILKERYSVLTDRDLKRAITGIIDERIYRKARVLREHAAAMRGSAMLDDLAGYAPPVRQPAPAARPVRWTPPKPEPKPQPAPVPVSKPIPRPQQTVLTGDPHDIANTILGDLRQCETSTDISATMARYQDCIAALNNTAPVRKIHIENLAKHKRK